MRRSITLISVGVTAFSIVLMVSVVYGLRVAASSRSAPLTAMPSAPALATNPELAAAAEVPMVRISPQAAVTVASGFLNRTDAYSVQLLDYNGQQAFIVTFSSGDVVYVSLGGEVLGSVPAGVEMASANKERDDRDGRGGNDEHDDDREHEEEEHEEEHESEGGD
jgi:hypothetical protein